MPKMLLIGWIEEINQQQAEVLDAQLTVEQLQQRDQLLTAQNEMLKMDRTNLKRKVAELDEMVKKLFGSQDIQKWVHQPTKIKENSFLRIGKEELSKRLAHSIYPMNAKEITFGTPVTALLSLSPMNAKEITFG